MQTNNMKEILLRAPATIGNFGPGFDIFSLALEKPYDEIKINLWERASALDISSPEGLSHENINIKVSGRDEGLPVSVKDNTAGVAAEEFFKRINSHIGVDIEIKKLMASGSGLGSSGASACGTVYGLNKLFGSNLSNDEIIDIASKGELASGNVAHSDNVAGCLLGGFVLIKNFNPLEVVKIEIPDIPIVMSVMKKKERTTRGQIPKTMSLDKVKEQMSYCAQLVYAIMSKDLEQIGRAINDDYISEPVRAKSIPKYREIKKKILDAGAYGVNISGGGSSVFAICKKENIDDIAEIMKNEFPANEVIITRASNEGIREIAQEER